MNNVNRKKNTLKNLLVGEGDEKRVDVKTGLIAVEYRMFFSANNFSTQKKQL